MEGRTKLVNVLRSYGEEEKVESRDNVAGGETRLSGSDDVLSGETEN